MENKKNAYEPFEQVIKRFTDEELAWDFHCNIGSETSIPILREALSRGVDLCRVAQVRRGGPVGYSIYTRPPCGKKCMQRLKLKHEPAKVQRFITNSDCPNCGDFKFPLCSREP